MAAPDKTFVNNNPPQCTAEDLNAYLGEINNSISGAGVTPNDAVVNQMIQAILKLAISATVYDNSGTANAVVLTRVGGRDAATSYYDGMRVAFVATVVNTGASTINVDGLGVKDIKRVNGDDLSPQDISGYTEAVYRSTEDYFIITDTAATSQMSQYDSTRVYYYGEIVYTVDSGTNERKYWQWYSDQESLAGKDPEDTANRRPGWADTTKPWYWVPYVGAVPGSTIYWDNDTLPELMVVGTGQQLPKVVYHRLYDAHPDWEDGTDASLINIPDRQGRFTRAADGSTWLTGATHEDGIRNIEGTIDDIRAPASSSGSTTGAIEVTATTSFAYAGSNNSSEHDIHFDASLTVPTTDENQPKGYIEWVGYVL